MINDRLKNAGDLSKAVPGEAFIHTGSHGKEQLFMAQVIPSSEGSTYEVVLESGVVTETGEIEFGGIGDFTNEQGSDPTLVPITIQSMYRFRLVNASAAVTVRAAG